MPWAERPGGGLTGPPAVPLVRESCRGERQRGIVPAAIRSPPFRFPATTARTLRLAAAGRGPILGASGSQPRPSAPACPWPAAPRARACACIPCAPRTCTRCRTSSSALPGRWRSCAAWACSPRGRGGRRSRSRRSSSSTRAPGRSSSTPGCANAVAEDGARRWASRRGVAYTDRDGAGWALPAQLRERGVDPMDVRTVVMTHLHYDHASAIAEFPQATFVVDAREWRRRRARGGFTKGYARKLIDHPYDWREVDFDDPRVASFARSGARSTSSATARSGCCPRPATRRATCRSCCASRAAASCCSPATPRTRSARSTRTCVPAVRRGRAPPTGARCAEIRALPRADARRRGHLRPRPRPLADVRVYASR